MNLTNLLKNNLEKIRILILDASERSALATIRSLGRRNVYIIAADYTPYAPSFFSKYVKEKMLYPSPIENRFAFISWIRRIVKEKKIDIIFSFTDHTTAILAQYKKDLEEFTRVGVPDWNIFLKTFDKMYTIMEAKKAQVPVPQTWLIYEEDEIRYIAQEIDFPVVIKPRRKIVWIGKRGILLKVTSRNYARTKEELIQRYNRILRENPFLVQQGLFPLIQQYIPGKGAGFEALISEGKDLLAFFMHKRIHEYPVTGGASTLRVSIYDKLLLHYGLKMLRQIKWDGVAMVEFRVSEKGPFLMEVNGRFWGSLPLAISAGVDFPYLYLLLLMNQTINLPSSIKYKLGIYQKWSIPGEFLWLFGKITQSLSNKKYSEIFKILRDFTQNWIKSYDDILIREDISPLIGAILISFQYLFDVLKGKRKITGETATQR